VDHSPELPGVNLEEALRLLRQSGQRDPLADGLGGVALLQRVIDGLCELSLRDGLTGLPNRRHLTATLERELDRVARTGEPAAVLLVDIDRFKQVNDTYGHLAGDRVLQAVGAALGQGLRSMDLAARTGGEEFAVVLPNVSPASARRIAERLRERIAAASATLEDARAVRVTASIGGALAPAWERMDPERLIALADQHLYVAKSRGRNCVSFEHAASSAVTPQERAMLLAFPRGRRP